MGNIVEWIENSIPSKKFVLVLKEQAATFKTKQHGEGLYIVVLMLDV